MGEDVAFQLVEFFAVVFGWVSASSKTELGSLLCLKSKLLLYLLLLRLLGCISKGWHFFIRIYFQFISQIFSRSKRMAIKFKQHFNSGLTQENYFNNSQKKIA